MAQDDSQERTEEPTPKRLKEAREKGQVPRSRELTTMLMLTVGAGAFIILGGNFMQGIMDLLTNSLQIERAQAFDTQFMVSRFMADLFTALEIITPFLLLMVVIAILSPLALGGWVFTKVTFKWDKIDPIQGMKRLFSAKALVEFFKTLAKFLVVGVFASAILWSFSGEFIGLGREPLKPAFVHMGELLSWSFLLISAALIIVALVDVPFQLWQHSKQLRMTRQEVRDEMKDTEGRPEVRGRIRQLQREMAERRMMEEVPKADVIVTNPTHFAVALRYDQERMGAPRVVAKGADLIAAQIRGVATESEVPLVAAPPLARALYFNAEIGDEIPGGLYLAVAQLLAYVYQLKTVQRQGGKKPKPPADLPVPEELLQR